MDVSFASQDFEKATAEKAKQVKLERERKERAERREKKLAELAGVFESKNVRDVLSQIPDERMKGVLYAKLMEDDSERLTAGEIVDRLSGCGEEVVESIFRAMEGLLAGGPTIDSKEVVPHFY